MKYLNTHIGGVCVLGVIFATIAFFMMGFIFYGVLFSDIWLRELMINRNLVELAAWPDLTPVAKTELFFAEYPHGRDSIYMMMGLLNAFITVSGMAFVLSRTKPHSWIAAASVASILALCFGVTSLAYDHIYGLLPLPVFWVDAFHQWVGITLAGIIYYLTASKFVQQ